MIETKEPAPIYEIVHVAWKDLRRCIVKIKTPRGGTRDLLVEIPIDLHDAESVADHVREVVFSMISMFRSRDEAATKLVGMTLHVPPAGRGNSGGSGGKPA